MECSGSVDFQVTYEGQKTDVLALVTPALQDEVLLSWRTLQRLDVIPKVSPCRRRNTAKKENRDWCKKKRTGILGNNDYEKWF